MTSYVMTMYVKEYGDPLVTRIFGIAQHVIGALNGSEEEVMHG